MPGCYILYSDELEKYYVGCTQTDVKQRIKKHNEAGYGKNRFTARAHDWTLFLFIETTDFAHAVRVERKIKAMKSSVYIQNLAKYPEMKDKLYSQTWQST
ncbi:MAG: GIY-YIG nuclease family protein [Petrimonas sp.]|nr:GIY-YIG nuclease family protein [Petrimonas sp.]